MWHGLCQSLEGNLICRQTRMAHIWSLTMEGACHARNILRHKRKQLGPRSLPVDVPEMSLASSGYVVHRELGRGGQGPRPQPPQPFSDWKLVDDLWMWQSCLKNGWKLVDPDEFPIFSSSQFQWKSNFPFFSDWKLVKKMKLWVALTNYYFFGSRRPGRFGALC